MAKMKSMIYCQTYDNEEHKKLLTQIRRSYWKIQGRLKTEEEVETPLFKFRKEDKDEFNKHRMTPRIWSILVSVIQKSTGKKYFVSMYLSFNAKDDWSLWKEEE